MFEYEGDVPLPLQEEDVLSVVDEIRQGDIVIFERVGPQEVNLRLYSTEVHRGYAGPKFRIGRGAESGTLKLSLLT